MRGRSGMLAGRSAGRGARNFGATCTHVVRTGLAACSASAGDGRSIDCDHRRSGTRSERTGARVSLSYDEIAEIIKLIDSSSCDELVVETGDMKLVVRRNGVSPRSCG